MSRSGAVTFKGNPLTLAGEAVAAGGGAPDFTLHYFEDGMQTLTLDDLKGKPTLLSVVPSLDTPVCATQTKKFNEFLGELGDRINAITVSLDLPFAMNRFCGAENIVQSLFWMPMERLFTPSMLLRLPRNRTMMLPSTRYSRSSRSETPFRPWEFTGSQEQGFERGSGWM